jgi:cyclic pyranopterin phosphate synthase
MRALLRSQADDLQIANAIEHLWQCRDDRYSELRNQQFSSEKKIEMSYIGG